MAGEFGAASYGDGTEEVKASAVELSVGRKGEDVIRRERKKEGYLQKRGYRFYNLCSCCVAPVWKDRYFVLSGGYLFRFANESHTKPKGRPVNLLGVTIKKVSDETGTVCLEIKSVRKTHLIRAPTMQELNGWYKALMQAKQHAIRVRMGHAPSTAADRAAAKLGSSIIRTKDRHEEESAKIQQEMAREATFVARSAF